MGTDGTCSAKLGEAVLEHRDRCPVWIDRCGGIEVAVGLRKGEVVAFTLSQPRERAVAGGRRGGEAEVVQLVPEPPLWVGPELCRPVILLQTRQDSRQSKADGKSQGGGAQLDGRRQYWRHTTVVIPPTSPTPQMSATASPHIANNEKQRCVIEVKKIGRCQQKIVILMAESSGQRVQLTSTPAIQAPQHPTDKPPTEARLRAAPYTERCQSSR